MHTGVSFHMVVEHLKHNANKTVLCTTGGGNETKNMPVPLFIGIDLDIEPYESQFDKRLNINRRVINLTTQINTIALLVAFMYTMGL